MQSECVAASSSDRRVSPFCWRRNPFPMIPLSLALLALTCDACLHQPVGLPRTKMQVRRLGAPRLSDAREQEQEQAPAPAVQPFAQAGVPLDQQPAQEFREMKRQAFFDWAELDDGQYYARVGYVFGLLSILLGVPIALSASESLTLESILITLVGGAVPTLAFVLRLRTGWGYVSNRLSEKQVYYEMNQRGYVVEKDSESAMRDRLLNEYEVVPVLKRVNTSAGAVAAILAACLVSVYALGGGGNPYDPGYLARMQSDEMLAQREQQRAQSTSAKPAYCDSRYYKAMAGAGGCD